MAEGPCTVPWLFFCWAEPTRTRCCSAFAPGLCRLLKLLQRAGSPWLPSPEEVLGTTVGSGEVLSPPVWVQGGSARP